jgi:hypothetical protein
MTRLRSCILALGALALSACSDGDSFVASEPERQCQEASERSGELECLHRIVDERDWQRVSVPLSAVDQVRSAKYLLPTRSNARLRPLFINGSRYELHLELMVEAFPELFPGLTGREYLRLLFDPAVREYRAGAVTEYRLPGGGTRFGFTVVGDPSTTGSITCDDVRAVRTELRKRLPVDELAAVPSDREQLGFLAECGVPVLDPTDLEYEVYHRAAAFGTVRRLNAQELPRKVATAEVGFQDILVLEQAPSDIETIVSGVVTGSRQAPLSHVAVRSAARGTPNCYLKDAYGYFEAWDGELVRLECGSDSLSVESASLEEAEAYWQQLEPAPVAIEAPDRDYSELVDAVELSTAEQRAQALSRFGAKGRNLAWLRQNLAPELTPLGFLIPSAHYFAFVESQRWSVDLGDGLAEHTFAETLESWQGSEQFRSNAALRRARLVGLQAAMEAATCDDALLEQVGQKLVATLGDSDVTARFRSSSNAEDGALFNGAGLYDSFSGCLADDLDDDELGPSRCDPSERNERTVCRALKRVWASLWNAKAYDERAFYGIDPSKVAMGVLVNERSEAELANMVAFSGNPGVRTDQRYLVNAQLGELPVVSPEPGVWPELVLLSLEEGNVTAIERVTPSSLAAPGEQVVSDTNLTKLGSELSRLVDIYPFDQVPPDGRTFLLDTEWKVMPDGQLRIKQVRPFLK